MSDCADCSDLATKITEAEAALHQVLLGKKATVVNFGQSKRVEYSQVNVDQLRAYIAELRNERARCCPDSGVKARGPVRFAF